MSGSLGIPNTFLGNSPDAISKLDQNFTTVAAYLNIREITVGALAARPAAGNPGAWYSATDVFGGTLYVDTGAVWVQVAAGVLAPTTGLALFLWAAHGGGF